MTRNIEYGPPLTTGHPQPFKGWNRPWGRIQTETVRTRSSNRLGKVTLSTSRTTMSVAILINHPEHLDVLGTKLFKLARNWRNNRLLDPALLAFSLTLLIGAFLLGTLFYQFVSAPLALGLLLLAIMAAIPAYLWERRRCQAAADELRARGCDWYEIRLGNDALAVLIDDLDAVAYHWDRGRVPDATWRTCHHLVCAVADEARHGARIDADNPELRKAIDRITKARQSIFPGTRHDLTGDQA
ncbi:hypothetical protein [Brachybacterium sp. Marseille-Q7125]|uniref:hypothetical protein n=1 Tax=Brachybacterium sp. Marseille-Q7125 TaxID=2932815 RepID=UPI001FF14109|nr:hypothetical protein [Brachybacterium sp. Marseille-Q7125]